MKNHQNYQPFFVKTGILTISSLAVASICAVAKPALAQAAYGSYIGIGPTFGVTTDDNDDGRSLGGVVAVRYKFLNLPVSLRAQTFIAESVSIVPTVSYDFPLGWQTDAYVGLGAAISTGSDTPSPVGDQTAFAIQPGIDYALPNSPLMVFGNAVIAFDAYENGGGTAVSIQGGVGLQF